MQPSDERQQHLEQLLTAIQQRWGVQALRRMEKERQSSIPTGYAALDKLLGHGGLPRGVLTLLSGHPTSGITTLALDTITQAQKNSEITIYIEVERTLDAEYVARRGIDLNRLLIICPQSCEAGFEMARDIMLGGGAGVLVCDLGGSLANPPSPTKALRRLTAGLSRVPYAVICLSTGSGPLHVAAASQAGIHLQLKRLRWLQRVERVAGYEVQVTILKNKSAPPGQTVALPILLDKRKRGL